MLQAVEGAVMDQSPVQLLLKDYLLADPLIPYISVIAGICASKMVYSLSQLISGVYLKSYPSLSQSQKVEWNNRAISTFHAIFITTVALYFTLCSDLYFSDKFGIPITLRSSSFSTFALGVVHHLASVMAVAYAMLTAEGQLYTYMVLISETTTPGINLRWYLDAAGMKTSRAYLINGIVMFISWMVARILLFIYLLYHVYLHYDQVKQMRTRGIFLVVAVPLVLSIMNLMWFGRIVKGLKKTLAKKRD